MLALLTAVVVAYVALLLAIWALLYAHGKNHPIRPPHS